MIVLLRRDIRQMQENFPRSSLNDDDLQLKIRYLNLVRDLGFIQDRIYGALLPIPEIEAWRMLRTVPQALYSLIMGTNPSCNQGDLRPVDSISWLEAKNFASVFLGYWGNLCACLRRMSFAKLLVACATLFRGTRMGVSDAVGVPQAVGTKEPFASGFTIYSATSAVASQLTVLRLRAPCILVDTRKTVSIYLHSSFT